jgi:hypothetical protein
MDRRATTMKSGHEGPSISFGGRAPDCTKNDLQPITSKASHHDKTRTIGNNAKEAAERVRADRRDGALSTAQRLIVSDNTTGMSIPIQVNSSGGFPAW